jgi:hypothetical protein
MIRFTTKPLKYEGTLENNLFQVPESPSTEAVLNTYARTWSGWQFGMLDPELELYNYVANRWPFINLEARAYSSQQLPLEFSLS